MKTLRVVSWAIMVLLSPGVAAQAAILVFQPDGGYSTKASLEAAATDPDAAGKTVVLTSPQTVSGVIRWPSDRDLKFEKGSYVRFSGSGAILGLKEVTPEMFHGAGDDSTLNDAAFAAMMRCLPKYGSYNDVYNATLPKLRYPKITLSGGTYRISQTWDLSFRNELEIEFDNNSLLKWMGPKDGTVVEAKCSSFMKTRDVKIMGQAAAGIFWHQSGDGTANGLPGTDQIHGKGNVTGNRHVRMVLFDQYPLSTKCMFDTLPYPADTDRTWHDSMDDSTLVDPFVSSSGRSGFAFGFGSSEILLEHPIVNTPNGVYLHPAAAVNMINPVFTLAGGDRGAVYGDLAPHSTAGGFHQMTLVSPYLEGSTKPLVSVNPAASSGTVHIVVKGGLLSQKPGATRIIDIPAAIGGTIDLDNIQMQGKDGRKVYAPGARVSLVTGGGADDFGIDIESAAASDVVRSGSFGMIRGFVTPAPVNLSVGSGDRPAEGVFADLDDALDAANNSPDLVAINLTTSQTLRRPHRISGSLQIFSNNGSRLAFGASVRVLPSGSLTIDHADISAGLNNPIVNEGQVFINTLTASVRRGSYLVQHVKGTTNASNITVTGGGTVVDGTYAFATGTVAHKGNVVSSGDEVSYAPGSMLLDRR